MHLARAFVVVLVLFSVALTACSAPASMASSEAPVVAAIIVKPRVATNDSLAVLKPIQAALGATAGVKYVRPMAGDAHVVYLTAPAQRADVPKLIERVHTSGAFDYVEVDSMLKIR
jgi:ABC-type phosphate/phosphonate transport system substrate-binding protein